MTLHALRGMNDILPDEMPLWHFIETTARQIFQNYQYQEIRTPVLEDMSVFTRSVGEATNIVEKEMYAFQDRQQKWVALRPEGTASVVRAYIEHNFAQKDPVARFYYLGPMYRHERPQKGRFRQFYQLGVEAFGISSPLFDAECIHMLDLFFKKLGLTSYALEINSLGCAICRPQYIRTFFDFVMKKEDEFCSDCKRRMERNTLRVLDCSQEACQIATKDAPSIQDSLCEVCEKDFDTVITTLGQLGTPYRVNSRIVRGLDYYLKTTFEFVSNALGAQKAIAGGGRYDGLIHLMGGPQVGGFGFAAGIERLIDVLKHDQPEKVQALSVIAPSLYIASLGEAALKQSFILAQALRNKGFSVDMDHEGRSLKSQMRRADKSGTPWVAILGDDEVQKKSVSLKNMKTGTNELVSWEELSSRLSA